ncbi:MAG: hypothetical protein Q4B85_02570 [Lachnospiraceae bacterium]|nr:hypothetical protein [Lachnospiraceae bacterium]
MKKKPVSKKKKAAGKKKRSSAVSRRRRKLILEMLGTVFILAALFWGLFYINSVEVVGNSGKNYRDQEIEEMTLPEFWNRNSVLLRIFRHKVDLEDVRFMDSVEVEFVSRNAIRLHVNEKKPVGFVRMNDRDFYFDHEGVVLEIMSAEETVLLKQQAADSAQKQQTETVPETEEEKSTEVVQEFNPTLADVPMITGLDVSEVQAGDQLPLNDTGFFNTIQFLTKMIDKYGIQPDYVEITENAKGKKEMTLYYGAVRAALGTDRDLEEKVTRLAAILPKLSGRSGVLHLEEFSGDTINLVFSENQ